MKFKKICYSTILSDLYGRDNYQSHIEVGREYWYYFSREKDFDEGWYKIKITCIRSGCVFYVFSDMPKIEERFFPDRCFMASKLVFAEIDPMKDMGNALEDDELSRKLYCFDDEHTVVKNWPNEKVVEIDDKDYLTCTLMSMLSKEVNNVLGNNYATEFTYNETCENSH